MAHTKFLCHSGTMIDFSKPETIKPTIEDIARGLSHIFRTVGQCPSPMLVAEHCLMVYEIIKAEQPENYKLQLAGLLHDAGEMFTGDIPTGKKNDHERFLAFFYKAFRYRRTKTLKEHNELEQEVLISTLLQTNELKNGNIRDIIFSIEDIKPQDELAFVIEMYVQDKGAYKDEMLKHLANTCPERVEELRKRLYGGDLQPIYDKRHLILQNETLENRIIRAHQDFVSTFEELRDAIKNLGDTHA